MTIFFRVAADFIVMGEGDSCLLSVLMNENHALSKKII